MVETIKKVTVSSPASVKVRVSSGAATRVQSIQYIASGGSGGFSLKDASDLSISVNQSGRGVMTYNSDTQQFVVQDVPRLEGGTF